MPAIRRKERSGPGIETAAFEERSGLGTSGDWTVVEVSDEDPAGALKTLTVRLKNRQSRRTNGRGSFTAGPSF
jgi:hypothetical protein